MSLWTLSLVRKNAAVFAIGDVHGALHALERLLERLDRIDPDAQLWFVGDLVNRGPDSAGVLRRVKALGSRAVVILGNHDLSLLSLIHRPDRPARTNASLRALLRAPDRHELLDWLRTRPLIHRDTGLGWTMVHAGIPPEWDCGQALTRAHELESALRGPRYAVFLCELMGDTPERWDASLTGIERLRYITNALTRQRFVDRSGALDMAYKKTLDSAPAHLQPWFAVANRASANERIVFGHWSALEAVAWPAYRVWGIDTGAAWGGRLSALRLDCNPPTLEQVKCNA